MISNCRFFQNEGGGELLGQQFSEQTGYINIHLGVRGTLYVFEVKAFSKGFPNMWYTLGLNQHNYLVVAYKKGQYRTNLSLLRQLQTVQTVAYCQDSWILSRQLNTVKTVAYCQDSWILSKLVYTVRTGILSIQLQPLSQTSTAMHVLTQPHSWRTNEDTLTIALPLMKKAMVKIYCRLYPGESGMSAGPLY